MAHVWIIGATGGIGHRLGALLAARGHQVTGLHRKPEQAAYLSGLGITPVHGDIAAMSAEDIATAAKGADVFVYCASANCSSVEATSAVDGEGPEKAVAAAKIVGAHRFLHVSAFPEAGRARPRNEGFEHYMVQKKRADVAVVRSGLNWVLLRPGTLEDTDGNGRVALDYALPYARLSRSSAAKLLCMLIERPDVHHRIFELTNGDTPLAQALAAITGQP